MAIAAGFPLETSDGVAFAKIKKDIPNGTLLSMSLFDVDPAYTPTKNGLQYDFNPRPCPSYRP